LSLISFSNNNLSTKFGLNPRKSPFLNPGHQQPPAKVTWLAHQGGHGPHNVFHGPNPGHQP
jgi:hypothetical protein